MDGHHHAPGRAERHKTFQALALSAPRGSAGSIRFRAAGQRMREEVTNLCSCCIEDVRQLAFPVPLVPLLLLLVTARSLRRHPRTRARCCDQKRLCAARFNQPLFFPILPAPPGQCNN